MKRILVPYDFSELSQDALAVAQQIASKYHGCTIMLLCTVKEPISGGDSTQEESSKGEISLKERIGQTENQLKELIQQTLEAKEVDYKISIRSLHAEITYIHAKTKLDLVIMGFLEGDSNESNPSSIISIPIIFINKTIQLAELKNILVVTGSCTLGEEFGMALRKIQDLLSATIHLLGNDENEQIIDQFVSDYNIENYLINSFPEPEKADSILNYAQKKGIDLIAVAHPQLTEIKYYLEQSLANQLISASPIPVWSHPQN